MEMEDEEEPRDETTFVVGQKIIRIIFCQSGPMSKQTGSGPNCFEK
jgi:hypothetical protein